MLESLLISSEINFKKNEPMSLHTSMRIGGMADYLINVKSEEELICAITACQKAGVRYIVVGNLSNTVFADNGYNGAVICTVGCNNIKIRENKLLCECGAFVSAASYNAYKASLTGMEFAYGIPGCIGGAVVMNAGAYGSDMSNVVKSVRAYDVQTQKITEFSLSECDFSYRHSVFSSGRYIVLSAVLVLKKGNCGDIKEQMQKFADMRKEKQPLDMPSAGSVFKRPEGKYVGAMIEELGLKGYRVGDACVSEKHAGFIVNLGNAKCDDLLKLIDIVKSKVLAAYNVELECEIKFIG